MARHSIIREDLARVPTPTDETPCGCHDGWVYSGLENEDESGAPVEVIELVPCRRCHADVAKNLLEVRAVHTERGVGSRL